MRSGRRQSDLQAGQAFFGTEKEESTEKQWPLVHADLIRVDNVHRTMTDLGDHKSIDARRAQLQQTIRECQMQRSIFVSRHIAPEGRKSVQELLGKSHTVKEASWWQPGI